MVYMLDTAVKAGKCAKLVAPWKGPGVVTEVVTPYLYKVRLRDKYTVINHDRLKPCLLESSALPAWINNHLQKNKSGTWDLFCHCNGPDYGTPVVLLGMVGRSLFGIDYVGDAKVPRLYL